jgi:hypothetical protein
VPYITKELREKLDGAIEDLLARMTADGVRSAGVANYVITRIVAGACAFASAGPAAPSATSYAKINEAVGVLECAKLELYRRLAGPYEDGKIAQNGDVKEYAPRPHGPPRTQ